MKNLLFKLCITFCITFSLCGAARADYLPPGGADCGGVNDLVLIYSGDISDQEWKAGDFDPYVFHLDTAGAPDGWFFDGFLFLAQILPGNQRTENDPQNPPTNLEGWHWFIDRIFEKGKFIDALDVMVSHAPAALEKPQPRKVVVMIPYPSPRATDFGDTDGDGKIENISLPTDRLKAVKWYVDTIIDKWNGAPPANLELAGFYWMEESYRAEDAETVKAASDYLHSLGKPLFWIPYYFGDPSTPRLKEFGFDCVAKQPNYFFARWQAEKSRVTTAARSAKKLGMGMEIEIDDTVISNPAVQYPKYLRYLNTGVKEGYMRGAYLAYYQGARTLANLAKSPEPRLRRLYDLIYDFVKGEYKPVEEMY